MLITLNEKAIINEISWNINDKNIVVQPNSEWDISFIND